MKKLTIVFVLALALAACGDSTEGDAPAAAEQESPTTTAAPVSTEAPTPTTEPQDHAEEMAESSDVEGDDHSAAEHQEDGHEDDSMVHDDDSMDASDGASADRTIEVAMTDFAYDPDTYRVRAGETVEFVVSNFGAVEHEFRLSNEHRIEEHIAAGHQDHDDEGGHHEDGDLILLVDPGETGSMVVTFTEDTKLYTQVACLLPGHYEAGMHVPLEVGV